MFRTQPLKFISARFFKFYTYWLFPIKVEKFFVNFNIPSQHIFCLCQTRFWVHNLNFNTGNLFKNFVHIFFNILHIFYRLEINSYPAETNIFFCQVVIPQQLISPL